MSQKVNPIAVRLGLNRHADSNWFSDYYYSTLFCHDYQIRSYLSRIKQPLGNKKGLRLARSIIHRYPKKSLIYLFCLGSKAQSSKSNRYLSNVQDVLTHQSGSLTSIIPFRVGSMYQSASLVAQYICNQLEQNKSFRQISKTILQRIEHINYIKGIRITCSGRLNGAEIAKTQCKKYGQTSLHVFSDRIDYASTKALTPYGILGVKVWISYI